MTTRKARTTTGGRFAFPVHADDGAVGMNGPPNGLGKVFLFLLFLCFVLVVAFVEEGLVVGGAFLVVGG